MRQLLVVLLLATPALAQKLQVEIVSSDESTQYYDQPARAACVPSAQGPICGARGAETRMVGFVQMKARINGASVTLVCNTAKDKHCARFQPGTYPADPKGKDELILYGWSNPIYRGDISKANKVKFKIGGTE